MPSETVPASCPGVKHHFSVQQRVVPGDRHLQGMLFIQGTVPADLQGIQATHVMTMSLYISMQPAVLFCLVFFNYYPLSTQEG